MLWQAISAVRDLGRVHDIASVLIRYGFGDVVRRIGMAGALERAGKILHWKEAAELAYLDTPERIRRALEELGPTFIKLGQILATRVDLFPQEWIAQFSKLQDEVPAVAYAEIFPVIRQELGVEPEQIFPKIDQTPLAAASLAQVHKAWLHDGTSVILKIRRPGIRRVIDADLRLLSRLADIIEAEAPELKRYHPREVVRQFTLSLRRELDFSKECRNAQRIATNLASLPEIVIPVTYWQWTSEALNVQQYIDGIAGSDLAAVDASGLNRKVLAQRGIHAVLKMILHDGFFHADPHPGNVYYLPGNRIAFIDFGMVGHLSRERRHELTRLLYGLVSQDSDRVAEVLQDWSGDTDSADEYLISEIEAFIDEYRGLPLMQVDFGEMLSDLVSILREHGLSLPPELALLVKAFITLEGMGRQLDPEFNIAEAATPMLEAALKSYTRPAAIAKRGWNMLSQSLGMLGSLPKDARYVARALRRGNLKMQIELSPLRDFGDRVDRAASRLALSVVTAALIVGSAIAMTVEKEGTLPGGLTYGKLGFIGAAIGGVWLLISIWRSSKH